MDSQNSEKYYYYYVSFLQKNGSSSFGFGKINLTRTAKIEYLSDLDGIAEYIKEVTLKKTGLDVGITITNWIELKGEVRPDF